jgi:hypothetical protein
MRTLSSRPVSRAGPPCALLALCAGCLQGDYNEDRIHQVVSPVHVETLQPGEARLQDVLALLGAPLYVVELDRGVALAFGWLDQSDWNVEAVVPVGDASMQFSYASADLQLPGLVVFLDEDYVVTRLDRGLLRDLLPDRARPKLVEDAESDQP